MRKIIANNVLRGAALVVALVVSVIASAQVAVTAPYSMSFEDSEAAALAGWVLNPGSAAVQAALQEKWTVGNATASDGHKSLYISPDNGASYTFTTTTEYTFAYFDFTIPAGTYNLTFDWRCKGFNTSKLYAAVAANTQFSSDVNGSVTTGSMPVRVVNLSHLYNDSYNWKNESFTFSSNGTRVYRLCFGWSNTNNDTAMNSVAACIDNIQITSAGVPQPANLEGHLLTCDSVLVTWDGWSEQYELNYRKRGTTNWHIIPNITNAGSEHNSIVIEGLEEGAYDFRVRGLSFVDSTWVAGAWRYRNSYNVFCPELHCINYVNLHDTLGDVQCFYGSTSNPMAAEGAIDFGYEDKLSRHTVCWDTEAYDPNVPNLPLVPEGELASVRLGNWNYHAEAEVIEYRYTVDAENAAILLVKYAVVLQDPAHNKTAQPRFKLEILDEAGQLIDPTCGAADFYAGNDAASGWATIGTSSNKVSYKPWTVLGLNLEDYDQQTITIRMTTFDCTASAHYGYAYFTLGCAAAKIQGTSCGEDTEMSIAAPIGFNYQWYDKYDQPVPDSKLSDDGRQLHLDASDTTTYRCHLSYKEELTCGFDLYSSAYPRFPIADFGYQYQPADCKNLVRFTNTSHIFTRINNVPEHHYDEGCDDYTWTFMTAQGDTLSQTSLRNPLWAFPNQGGRFQVSLEASISEGRCAKDTTIWITLPQIGDTIMPPIDTTICEGSYIQFDKYYAAAVGEYPVTKKSFAGCDSTVILRILKVASVTKEYVGDTTICDGDQLTIGGQTYRYDYSGEFYRFYHNQYGCDSTVWMNVTVLDPINPTVVLHDVVGDQQNSGSIEIGGSGYTYYTVNGIRNGALTGLNGGEFVLNFYNDLDCYETDTVHMSYPCHSIIFQRWNDVLGMMNEAAQAERSTATPISFITYQWMRNGEDIPGATKSYLYVPEGLSASDYYELRGVTAEGETIISCPYTPMEYGQQNAPRKIIQNQQVFIIMDNSWYTILGEKVK